MRISYVYGTFQHTYIRGMRTVQVRHTCCHAPTRFMRNRTIRNVGEESLNDGGDVAMSAAISLEEASRERKGLQNKLLVIRNKLARALRALSRIRMETETVAVFSNHPGSLIRAAALTLTNMQNNPKVVTWSLALLASVGTSSGNLYELFAITGVCRAIASCMQRFIDVPAVQIAACDLLHVMSRSQDVQPLRRAGILIRLGETIATHTGYVRHRCADTLTTLLVVLAPDSAATSRKARVRSILEMLAARQVHTGVAERLVEDLRAVLSSF